MLKNKLSVKKVCFKKVKIPSLAFFKNVKISTLILLLMIISMVTIGGMSALGIINMRKIDSYTDALYSDRMIPTSVIEEVQSKYLKIRINITGMLLMGYDEEYDKRISIYDEKVKSLLSEYENTDMEEDEEQLLAGFKRNYENYVTLWQSIKEKVKNGDTLTDDEKVRFSNVADNIAVNIENNVADLVEYNLSKSEDMVDMATSIYDDTIRSFITILIAASAIYIVFSVMVIAMIKKNMAQINNYLHKIAEYDFKIDINVDGSNEFFEMRRSLLKAIENIRNAIGEVRKDTGAVTGNAETLASVSQEMASSSNEVSMTVQEVAAGASSQAQELSGVVSLISDLTGDIDIINEELKTIRNKTDNTVDKAKLGEEEMRNLIKSVKDIRNVFGLVVEKISNLNNTVEQIGNITDVITGISEQTNLLALNAAIEAARAGEMGRGFAVVADEVRKLAENSKKSTDEISSLISSINMETNEVIKTSDDMEDHVTLQSNAAAKAIESFKEILESIETITPLIEETYKSMDNTIKSKDKVLEKVEVVSAVTEENSAASEEVAASTEELSAASEEVASTAESLNEMAEKLMEVVDLFKIE